MGGVWAFSYVFVRFFQITSLLRSVGVATKFGVHSNVIGWDVVVWLYICCFVMEVGKGLGRVSLIGHTYIARREREEKEKRKVG